MLKTLFFILGLSACAKHGPASGVSMRAPFRLLWKRAALT